MVVVFGEIRVNVAYRQRSLRNPAAAVRSLAAGYPAFSRLTDRTATNPVILSTDNVPMPTDRVL